MLARYLGLEWVSGSEWFILQERPMRKLTEDEKAMIPSTWVFEIKRTSLPRTNLKTLASTSRIGTLTDRFKSNNKQSSIRDLILLIRVQLLYLRLRDPRLFKKYIGPVTILKRVGKVAYKVDAPSWWKMHPVFHVSLLKKYHEDIEEPQLLLLETITPLYLLLSIITLLSLNSIAAVELIR